jgi:AcrR family transcriptional regulator
MGRPRGTRSQDYEHRRAALAQAMLRGLTDDDGAPATFRGLARAAGVTLPTLKHYFSDHDGAVEAALQSARALGRVYVDQLADPGPLPLATSLRGAAHGIVRGWTDGVGVLFGSGLSHGLGNARRGPVVVDLVLEPALQALEKRLAVHAARGELRPKLDLRAAALSFLSPLLFALLHQQQLGGAACRPLDVDAFATAHVDGWLRGYAAADP